MLACRNSEALDEWSGASVLLSSIHYSPITIHFFPGVMVKVTGQKRTVAQYPLSPPKE